MKRIVIRKKLDGFWRLTDRGSKFPSEYEFARFSDVLDFLWEKSGGVFCPKCGTMPEKGKFWSPKLGWVECSLCAGDFRWHSDPEKNCVNCRTRPRYKGGYCKGWLLCLASSANYIRFKFGTLEDFKIGRITTLPPPDSAMGIIQNYTFEEPFTIMLNANDSGDLPRPDYVVKLTEEPPNPHCPHCDSTDTKPCGSIVHGSVCCYECEDCGKRSSDPVEG